MLLNVLIPDILTHLHRRLFNHIYCAVWLVFRAQCTCTELNMNQTEIAEPCVSGFPSSISHDDTRRGKRIKNLLCSFYIFPPVLCKKIFFDSPVNNLVKKEITPNSSITLHQVHHVECILLYDTAFLAILHSLTNGSIPHFVCTVHTAK